MPDVEIAAAIFAARMCCVLRELQAGTEIPIGAYVVEGMRVRITGHHIQSVVVPGRESYLKAVVVGAIDIRHLVDVTQIRKSGIERPPVLLGDGIDSVAADARVEAGSGAGGPTGSDGGLVDIAHTHQI